MSLEEKGMERFEEKEGTCERNEGHWKGRTFGGSFFFIIQNHLHLGLINCIGREF